MKPASSAAAAAKPTTVVTLSQPHCGASMIVNTSVPMAAIDSTRPSPSSAGASASFDSGTSRHAATKTTTTTGTFTNRTEPHQACSSSQPPMIGPAATATPLTALQIPIALARSPGSVKVLVRIASVAGKISAAPTPISARPAMSISALPASPANADVAPNTTRPTMSARLRPYRSPSPPAASSRPVNTRRYASTIHWSWLVDASRAVERVGRATLTMVPSRTVTNTASETTARIAQRRSWTRSRVVGASMTASS